MKQNDGYLLQEISGIYYILPYGQQVLELRRGMKTNATGAFLWKALEKECSRESLLKQFIEYCKAEESEAAETEKILDSFLAQLRAQNMLCEKENICPFLSDHSIYMEIAGITLKLILPTADLAKGFQDFVLSEEKTPDQTIEVYYDNIPHNHPNGTILMRNQQLILCDTVENYLLLFPNSSLLAEAYLKKDGSRVIFYCNLSKEGDLADELFHAIRLTYIYFAQKKRRFVLHSASILYQGKAWLFSGKSGEGKSTHTKLWNKLFQTPFINGDLNLISFCESIPYIHGTPWCGTSGIYDTKSYPLGGIILLKQNKTDVCVPLSEDEKQVAILKRLISPFYTKEHLQCNLSFVRELTEHITVYQLLCTPDDSAAYTMKKQIDEDLFL